MHFCRKKLKYTCEGKELRGVKNSSLQVRNLWVHLIFGDFHIFHHEPVQAGNRNSTPLFLSHCHRTHRLLQTGTALGVPKSLLSPSPLFLAVLGFELRAFTLATPPALFCEGFFVFFFF
jgi:hypothetical protein